VRLFQLHLAETGASICTRNRTMTGLGFLFGVTLRQGDIADQIQYIREPQTIPLVMSPDEVKRLLAAAPSLKSRVLLSLAYGCGLRAAEVISLKVSDIDSAQKVIRIEQAKGRKVTAPDTHRAIEAVFRIEQARLIASLARMVRDVGLAEELAQDALIVALERWPQTGIPDKPGAWLMATAKHRAIDLFRRNKLLERKHVELG
jgi:integrase